ncbi:MAG TPA: MFS transporter [Candidatus Dormibacteraeota bacterium]|nr:MFS transporter [Candidatus Dormibacteraeota bacterium]
MAVLAHEAAHLDGPTLDRARLRSRIALFLGVAVGSTGYIAAVTVASIVAKDLLGDVTLAGVPSATVVLGAAAGAVLLSGIMARRGRRMGLTIGYLVAVLGALVATLAVIVRSFPLLIVGTFLIGFGNSANNLSRYAAADLVPTKRRPVAIGLVVWAATIGGVVGPWLVPLAQGVATGLGLPPLAGPYLVPVVFVAIAAALSFILLRPDPFALADESAARDEAPESRVPIRTILTRPIVLAAIVALVGGQATMTLIMTMTPLHLTDHGHGLGTVGLVISGHVAGMFALAPVSGWLTQRFGSVRTIFLGAGVLMGASALAALSPPESDTLLFVALFLLGFGWNLGFVAGSTLLSSGVSLAERARVQGAADAVIWSTSAVASVGSSLVVAAAGYTTLGLLGVVIVIGPAALLLRRRNLIATATAAAG